MGVNPNLWGYHQWMILHLMAYNYPVKPTNDQKLQVTSYITSMASLLPCPGCSLHCTRYIEKHSIISDSKKSLFNYLVDMHNDVNKRLGKRLYDYDEAWKNIETGYIWSVNSNVANRAQDIRKEDHSIIKKLQDDEKNSMDYKHLLILNYATLIIIVLFLIYNLYKRFTSDKVH